MSTKFYTFDGPHAIGRGLWTYQVLTRGPSCTCFSYGSRDKALADARKMVDRLNRYYGREGKRYGSFSEQKDRGV